MGTAFNQYTGFGDEDPYAAFGIGSDTYVYADNSYGAPDEQTSTPTGTGTGTFLDSVSQGGILDKLLNYAMLRDQQRMTAVSAAPVQAAQAQATVTASKNSTLILYGLIALGVVFVATRA